jgi:hypothetical protein
MLVPADEHGGLLWGGVEQCEHKHGYFARSLLLVVQELPVVLAYQFP